MESSDIQAVNEQIAALIKDILIRETACAYDEDSIFYKHINNRPIKISGHLSTYFLSVTMLKFEYLMKGGTQNVKVSNY